MRQETEFLVGSFLFIVLVFFVGLGVGGPIWVNIPDGVACTPSNLPCRWLRLRHPKVIIKQTLIEKSAVNFVC